MRLNDTTLKPFARRALTLALLLSALALTAAKADAQIDLGTYVNFGSSVGVARGQVARLTVVWARVLPPDPRLPPGPCKTYGPFNTTLALVDASGRVVARQSVALARGRPAALNFAPSEFGAGGRAQLRAQITVDRDAEGFIPCIMPSLEVFDNATGKTSLFYPGSMIGE